MRPASITAWSRICHVSVTLGGFGPKHSDWTLSSLQRKWTLFHAVALHWKTPSQIYLDKSLAVFRIPIMFCLLQEAFFSSKRAPLLMASVSLPRGTPAGEHFLWYCEGLLFSCFLWIRLGYSSTPSPTVRLPTWRVYCAQWLCCFRAVS